MINKNLSDFRAYHGQSNEIIFGMNKWIINTYFTATETKYALFLLLIMTHYCTLCGLNFK